MSVRLVVIGASRGGLNALEVVLSSIDKDFSWPIVVAQHRERNTSSVLANFMEKNSTLKIYEPEDKEPIQGKRVYLAPADYHLLIDDDHFALSTAAPEGLARPSIDYLFESAADVFRSNTIGVILTGLNRDGSAGVKSIKEAGGHVIIQDPATAECAAMPLAAMKAAAADKVLPLPEIAPYLNDLWTNEQR